jgi:ornithine--oxo-acid transaminase
VTPADYIVLEQRYGAHNYHPLPVVLASGHGSMLVDVHGRQYIDMMSGYSAVSLGHANPGILAVLIEQASRLGVTSRAFHNDVLPVWMRELATLTGLARVLPMNTGAEAVETALKIARKWGEKVKGIAPGAGHIIGCEGSFHGRTFGAISLSTEPQYRDGFGPLLPNMHTVPYGNVQALADRIHALGAQHVAAFIVEPIQGEAGIRVPPAGYLKAVRDLCQRHNVLLIVDEVQTGLGRTGKLLCCEHEGVQPDLLVLGKALGGGVYPVSAVVGTEQAMCVLRPGDHGSTFGGNPIAAAVSLEALRQLGSAQLLQRVATLGKKALARLRAALQGCSAVVDIRGRGLFVGVEVRSDIGARRVVEALAARGVLTKDTHEVVIRLAPPLVITDQELDIALEQLIDVLLHIEATGRA